MARDQMLKTFILIIAAGIFISGCCSVPPGQIKKETTPGHIQQETGYNPASGKIKPR
ncbi:MAG: hypothetical protein NC914_02825 [Candidatus Omnitrophica bacterium]|nr:hypothetical protein [Candidatus Omnitrophota bacterium]